MQPGGALDGAVGVVTGASGGIGGHIAAALRAAGADVVLADLDGDALGEAAERIPSSVAVRTDVTNEAQVDALMDAAVQHFGRVDIAVNAAGMIHVSPLLDHDFAAWQRVLAVNAGGTFLVTRAAGRVMAAQEPHASLQRRGMVLNVSSGASFAPRPVLVAYGASKAAVNHLSMSTAAALGPLQIATTVLYPGNVREGMWRSLTPVLAAAQNKPEHEIEAERAFQPVEETTAIAMWAITTPGMALNGMGVVERGIAGPIEDGLPGDYDPISMRPRQA